MIDAADQESEAWRELNDIHGIGQDMADRHRRLLRREA